MKRRRKQQERNRRWRWWVPLLALLLVVQVALLWRVLGVDGARNRDESFAAALSAVGDVAETLLSTQTLAEGFSRVRLRPVALLLATEEWANETMNWLIFAARAGALPRVLVLSDSQPLCARIGERFADVACSAAISRRGNGHKELMVARDAAALFLLAHAAVDVILTDTDALWMRDPSSELVSMANADMAWSQEPWKVTPPAQWPALSPCLGFGLLRATPGTLRLMTAALHAISESPAKGDTEPFVLLLAELGTEWGSPRFGPLFAVVNGTKSTLELLPLSFVSRPASPEAHSPGAAVVHPHSRWDRSSKRVFLANFGLWQL